MKLIWRAIALTFFLSVSVGHAQNINPEVRPFGPMDLSILFAPPEGPAFGLQIFTELLSLDSQNQILNTLAQAWMKNPADFPKRAELVGLRLDPCGSDHFSSLKANCVPQLRLIAQEPDIEDRTLHLIYRLSWQDFSTLASQFQALNQECSMITPTTTLTVNPCSGTSTYRESILQLVRAAALESRLIKVAFQTPTSTKPNVRSWIFAALVKKVNQPWQTLNFHWAPLGQEIFAFGKGKASGEMSGRDGIDQQINGALNGGLNERATTGLLLELEDISLRTVKNTSCFACHATQALRGQFDALKLVTPNYFQSATGLEDTRHFGYLNGAAKISQRTKIETAASVQFMNQQAALSTGI